MVIWARTSAGNAFPPTTRPAIIATSPRTSRESEKEVTCSVAGPGRAELGPEGDHHERPQALHAFGHKIQELHRRRVDPVHILIDGQDRLLATQGFKLPEQDLEGALLLALGRQIQGRVAALDRQR